MSTQAMTEQIAEYFKTQPVLKAWIFGSFSRGEQTPESDIDILVVLDESQHIGMKFIFLRTQGAGTLCVRHAGTSECCALEWSLGYDKTETEAALASVYCSYLLA